MCDIINPSFNNLCGGNGFEKIGVKEDEGEKIRHSYYFPIFIGIGLIFGVVLNQIAIGLCLGVAIGLSLDSKKKK